MKSKGFTLAELGIIMVFIGIIGSIVYSAVFLKTTATELRCVDGHKFVVSHDGQARQVMDEFGKGAKCQ